MHNAVDLMSPPRLQARRSTDADQHALTFEGWQMRYDQLSPGRFSGHTSELKLPNMQILRDYSNQAMNKKGSAWPGALTFSLPLYSGCVFQCAGNTIKDGRWLVARGDRLPELRTPPNLDLLCISVMEDELVRLLHEQGSQLRSEIFPGGYRLTMPRRQLDIVQLAQALFTRASQPCQVAKQGAIWTSIRETVLLQLLDVLNSDEDPTDISSTARMRLVAKARDLVLDNPDAPPSILELCNHVGASRRKLQYCFQDTLGINPVAYLRILRLNAVQRALRKSSTENSVQDVAAQWGFWHLSRLASEYKQLFGEKPSETLRRPPTDS